MIKIFTIGFTKKNAKEFFESLKRNNIEQLIDVRLNNTSQLAGFSKHKDLEYFLISILKADYKHIVFLSPTKEILDAYKQKKISWNQYEEQFIQLLEQRKVHETLDRQLFNKKTVLLCSEATADKCHRRLVVEYLKNKWGNVEIIHL